MNQVSSGFDERATEPIAYRSMNGSISDWLFGAPSRFGMTEEAIGLSLSIDQGFLQISIVPSVRCMNTVQREQRESIIWHHELRSIGLAVLKSVLFV